MATSAHGAHRRPGCCAISQSRGAGEVATSLDASRNALEHVPGSALATLRSLTALNLCRNQLRSWPLPPHGGTLPALLRLELCGNRALPPPPPGGLACCAPSLTLLDLSGATLTGPCSAAGDALGVHALYACTPCAVSVVCGPRTCPAAPCISHHG